MEQKPSADPGPSQPGNGETLVRLRWPLVAVALLLVALVAYLVTLRSAGDAARGAGDIVREVGSNLGQLAEGFRSGTITHTFVSALPDVASTGTGNLELATSTVTETLRQTDERRILWDRVSLGETVSEIRVPVTYRYHVRLDDPWRLEISGSSCIVHAPALQPTQPPAIHTDRLEKHTANGWLRFNATQQLEELERNLTPTLQRYAADDRHLAAAREQSRKTLARFVRGWLLREDHWREDRFRAVIVQFADEPSEFDDRPPTLVLGD